MQTWGQGLCSLCQSARQVHMSWGSNLSYPGGVNMYGQQGAERVGLGTGAGKLESCFGLVQEISWGLQV